MANDIGKLILRVLVGGLLLFHGIAKLNHGLGFIRDILAAKGMPEFIAYGAYIGEVIAPIMLLIGYRSRLAAVLIIFNMIMAILLIHTHEFFDITNVGGYALELQLFYLFGSVVIALIGSGKYALKRD